jgi:hypothetical protein
MQASTIGAASVRLEVAGRDLGADVTYDPATRTATLTAQAPLVLAGLHRVIVEASVASKLGKQLKGGYQGSFTVRPGRWSVDAIVPGSSGATDLVAAHGAGHRSALAFTVGNFLWVQRFDVDGPVGAPEVVNGAHATPASVQIGLDDLGRILVVWAELSGGASRIFFAWFDGNVWSAPGRVDAQSGSPWPSPGQDNRQPRLDVRPDGSALACWDAMDPTLADKKFVIESNVFDPAADLGWVDLVRHSQLRKHASSAGGHQVRFDSRGSWILATPLADATSPRTAPVVLVLPQAGSPVLACLDALCGDPGASGVGDALAFRPILEQPTGLIAVWLQHSTGAPGSAMQDRLWSSRFDHGTRLWSPAVLVDDPDAQASSHVGVASGPDGVAHAVWNQRAAPGGLADPFGANRTAPDGPWQTASFHDLGLACGGTVPDNRDNRVAIDRLGNGLATWTQAGTCGFRELWTRSLVAGTWQSDHERRDSQFADVLRPALTLDDSARSRLFWIQSDTSGTATFVWESRFE